jgi:hypothetical protein
MQARLESPEPRNPRVVRLFEDRGCSADCSESRTDATAVTAVLNVIKAAMVFHYHAKVINAERVGKRLVRVACTRCGCEYYYNFTRIGVGSAQAPYGLGVDRATRTANHRAQKDLERRLALEAELVPCPKCNWINDELVAGFRRGSYRNLGDKAGLIAAVGVIIGVVLGVAFAFNPAAVLTYAFVLPAGLLLFAGGLFLLRSWLRSRIRPNGDHPLAPKLPPGSPPALVKDPMSGKLVAAKPEFTSLAAGQDWCDFQVGRHNLPPLCCGCLAPTTPDGGHLLRVTTTMRLTIPRCADCAQATQRRSRRLWWNGAMAGMLATAAIVIPIKLDWLEFTIASVGVFAVSLIVTALVVRRMTAPAKVAGGDRSRGVVRLRFRNADYARAVAERLNG